MLVSVPSGAPDEVADGAEAGRVTDTVKRIGVVLNDVSEAHKVVKAPYLECGRAVDAWKNRLTEEATAVEEQNRCER